MKILPAIALLSLGGCAASSPAVQSRATIEESEAGTFVTFPGELDSLGQSPRIVIACRKGALVGFRLHTGHAPAAAPSRADVVAKFTTARGERASVAMVPGIEGGVARDDWAARAGGGDLALARLTVRSGGLTIAPPHQFGFTEPMIWTPAILAERPAGMKDACGIS